MQIAQIPTEEEVAQFSITAFKGIEVGIAKADKIAEIAEKLEEQYPMHLVLIQAGKFLHGYDRTEALASYQAMFAHTGTTY